MPLDANGWSDGMSLDALGSQVTESHLDGDGGAVVEDPEHKGPHYHVVQNHCEEEGAMIMRGPIRHFEELVGDGNVSALPHCTADNARLTLAQNGLQHTVLSNHEVAQLLEDAADGVSVKMRQRATHGELWELGRLRGKFRRLLGFFPFFIGGRGRGRLRGSGLRLGLALAGALGLCWRLGCGGLESLFDHFLRSLVDRGRDS
mmetsp:Transcript_113397/g.326027  ORF Transcript_113397/g.326027 Transcript_113397/m.326027 type:complete len:203 (-) Transcript_113397:1204-1812(-)